MTLSLFLYKYFSFLSLSPSLLLSLSFPLSTYLFLSLYLSLPISLCLSLSLSLPASSSLFYSIPQSLVLYKTATFRTYHVEFMSKNIVARVHTHRYFGSKSQAMSTSSSIKPGCSGPYCGRIPASHYH